MHHSIMIVPFEPWHYVHINARDEQKHLSSVVMTDDSIKEAYAQNLLDMAVTEKDGDKCAWTILIDGAIAVVGGVVELTPFTGECWTMFSQEFLTTSLKNKVISVRKIKESLKNADIERLQSIADNEFDHAHRWLKQLGFTPEGVLRSYIGKGNDVTMYSLIKGDT